MRSAISWPEFYVSPRELSTRGNFLQRAAKAALLALSPDELFTADNPARILVERDSGGNVVSLRVLDRIGPAQVYRRTAGDALFATWPPAPPWA
jgi:hypothetical protein